MPRLRMPIRALPRRQRGFTLVEMVAAFVIFAIGFGILMQILSTCLHTTTQSADYTQAALWAESLLDPIGAGEPIREGASRGRFAERFSWRLRIGKIDPPEPLAALGAVAAATPGNANVAGPQITNVGNNTLELYQIELDVSWGSYYMTHNARFVTLRAAMPENGPGAAGPFVPGMGRPR